MQDRNWMLWFTHIHLWHFQVCTSTVTALQVVNLFSLYNLLLN